MPIEQILIEYAKLHLQLTQANNTIAQLQARIKELTPTTEAKSKSKSDSRSEV